MSCPIRMSDGRQFTNYNPRCAFNSFINEKLTENKMINSSYEMRLYLQQNHDDIVKQDRENAIRNIIPCKPCSAGEFINDKNPELANKYHIVTDGVSCHKYLANTQGLGTSKFF
jgi:hypothetical protein